MKQENYGITKAMKEVVIEQLVYNTMKPRIDELGEGVRDRLAAGKV